MTLPPLDESDTLVRTLVQAAHRESCRDGVAPDQWTRSATSPSSSPTSRKVPTPAKHLKVLRPSGPFPHRVAQRSVRLPIRAVTIATRPSPTPWRRSIRLAAARLYATLKPRIEDAHHDLGSADSFDRTLERAIVALLRHQPIDGSERLRPKGIGYGYTDERLESLTPAQKQLLRMGPRNVRVIKTKLREIAIALGIPPSHLPAP